MQQKVEGLLIKTIPYQERHLIGHLLLRNGKKITTLFYGGQGGGKKMKTTGLELGQMLEVELSFSRGSEFYRAKAWSKIWEHSKIRYDYKAFALLCFYAEMAGSMAQEENLHEENFDDDIGLFRAISNGVFHLENQFIALEKKLVNDEIVLFLGKLLSEQGIFPQLDYCCLSDLEISSAAQVTLIPEHGSFAITSQLDSSQQYNYLEGRQGKVLWKALKYISSKPYQEIENLGDCDQSLPMSMWNYLCYQMDWKKDQFKTWNTLF